MIHNISNIAFVFGIYHLELVVDREKIIKTLND